MKKEEQNTWQATVALPPGVEYQWKTLVLEKDGKTSWDPPCGKPKMEEIEFYNHSVAVSEKDGHKLSFIKKVFVRVRAKRERYY